MKRATRANRCNNANIKKKKLDIMTRPFHNKLRILHSQILQISGQDEKKRRKRVKETAELQTPAQCPLSLTGRNKGR